MGPLERRWWWMISFSGAHSLASSLWPSAFTTLALFSTKGYIIDTGGPIKVTSETAAELGIDSFITINFLSLLWNCSILGKIDGCGRELKPTIQNFPPSSIISCNSPSKEPLLLITRLCHATYLDKCTKEWAVNIHSGLCVNDICH